VTGPIVLIEDDPDVAALMQEMLRDTGHPVDVRVGLDDDTGDDEARVVITDLVALRRYDVDLAREWIAKVRVRFPRAKIVVSTAHARVVASGPEALGADAVLAKPFDLQVFVQTVEALLVD
jgi:DNA-binding response OmpR family regulator